MVRTKTRDLLPAFVGIAILLTSVAISKDPLARAWPQKPQKVVSNEDFGPDAGPLRVSEVKIREHGLNLNEPFEGHDEWIRDIYFRIKNRSTKNITYVGINLVFSDTSSSDPAMVRQLRFGRRSDGVGPPSETLFLKPGDSFEVSIPGQYESLKKFIEMKKQIKNIDKVTISAYLVFFDDGMKWDVGNFYLPDPTQPFGFRKIEAPAGIIKKKH
jgi:hypothetical protein